MSLRSEICARLLLPLIVTLLTVLAVFKLSGTDLHFAKYCAEATLVYAAVLLFPFIIRAALWGIFQFIVALQMCSIVSTGIYIVPLTVMNLSSHNARRTQPVSKCNSPVNPGCSILRGQSTLAHSPPSPSQFFTPIANVGANSFKQRSTDRARFRFFDACSCS